MRMIVWMGVVVLLCGCAPVVERPVAEPCDAVQQQAADDCRKALQSSADPAAEDDCGCEEEESGSGGAKLPPGLRR